MELGFRYALHVYNVKKYGLCVNLYMPQIKDARNACMHSSNLEMSDTDTQTTLNLLLAFLAEPAIQTYPAAADAAHNIKQVTTRYVKLI